MCQEVGARKSKIGLYQIPQINFYVYVHIRLYSLALLAIQKAYATPFRPHLAHVLQPILRDLMEAE